MGPGHRFPAPAAVVRVLRRPGLPALVSILVTAGVAAADFSNMLGFRSRANSAVELANGQVLVAGVNYPTDNDLSVSDAALTRLNSDGSTDTSFGLNGVVISDLGSDQDFISDMAVQPDGGIVVSGWLGQIYGNSSFMVARFLANGQLDASFGSGGVVTNTFGATYSAAFALTVQDDGKIVAAGFSSTAPNTIQMKIVRLNPDGSFDPAFGAGGVALQPGVPYARVVDVALQNDGKVVAVGAGYGGGPGGRFSVLRYNLDGSLDNSFDSDGSVTAPLSGDSLSIAVQGDQKLVVAGTEHDEDTGNEHLTVARFNSDGSLDSSFGTGGLAGRTIDWSPYSDPGTASVALQSDGKIIVSGNCYFGFAVVRFLPDGTLDPGFTAHYQQDPGPDVNLRSGAACGLVVQDDDRILLPGLGSHGSNESFATVRYTADGLPDSEFEYDGVVIESDCRRLPLPSSVCLSPRRASLQMKMKYGNSRRLSLTWGWAGHEVFDDASIGTPGVDNRFSLCVYDSTGGVLHLATWLDLYESDDWVSYPPNGWSYRNLEYDTRDGARRIRLKSAPEGGTSLARLRAQGAYNLPLPITYSETHLMDLDPRIVVQFVGTNGFCLTSEFTADDLEENLPTSFEAKKR